MSLHLRAARGSRGLSLFPNLIRFGCMGFAAIGVASWLAGCGSTDAGGPCTTAAECAAGQSCAAGQCVDGSAGANAGAANAGAGAPGLAGSTTSSSGNGNGSVSVGGSSSIGGAPGDLGGTGTGAQSFGGSVAQAGSSSGGRPGNVGSGGTANQAGGTAMGGRSGSGSQSAAGASGSAGVMGGGDVVGKCKDDYLPAANNGSVTRYDFSQGTSLPACAYVITHKGAGKDGDWDTVEGISTGDGGYFGAMNTTDYNLGATCGACAEITYNGSKKVVVTIVDECPVGSNSLCVKGHIDLSRKAIRQLQPSASLERLGSGGNGSISWRYVTCPVTGNAKLRLHPNQSSGWQPVVVENGLYPLASVTINGANAVRAGNNKGGNAWLAAGQKLPFDVRATDVNGNTIDTNFSGGTTLLDSGKQFMCKK